MPEGFDIDTVRKTLTERRQQLSIRKQRADADRDHRRDPLVADFADQAVQTQNDETLAVIAESAGAEIAAIDAALHQLEAGNYGTCTQCGEPIEAARLRAIPYSILCARCAAR